jgi:hypothetical protein
MRKTRLLAVTAVAAAVTAGISACKTAADPVSQPASASSGAAATAASSQPAPAMTATTGIGGASSPAGAVTGVSTGPGSYIMQAMPVGTVSFHDTASGALQAQITVTGLTPGSSHDVTADSPSAPPVQFPALTAGPGGQASAALDPDGGATSLPAGGRIVISLGTAADGALAAQPVAETGQLPARPQPGTVFTLHAVTAATDGTVLGQAAGTAKITYDAAAQTLTVTLTASGLTPGPHAAHIHLGTCQDQGAVKYMLPDFTADDSGAVTSQTRVVTGVTSVPGPGAWYLNLHQGSSAQILTQSGTPTLYFRPVLCTDITSFATGSSSAAAQPTASMTAAPSGSMPSDPSPTASAAGGDTMVTAPSAAPSPAPSYAAPTHW